MNRSGAQAGGTAQTAEPSAAPSRAPLVLVALILVAAVANLNLSVANVALPSIGERVRLVADDAQPDRGRLLARPRGVGALAGRDRRPLRAQAPAPRSGIAARRCRPACWPRTRRPTRCSSSRGSLGGLAAGMAYPTTLALITALWSGAGRTKSIALWSGIGGAIAALGPLVVRLPARALLVGLGLPGHAAAGGGRARAWPGVYVPAHVNETTEPVDNLGGILSILLVGALILAINFAPVPNEGALALGLAAIALAAGVAFVLRQRRAANPLYDLTSRPADLLGRRGRGDHRVRLAHGRDVHRPAVPAERARLLHARGRGVDPPGGVADGARRAALGEARRGARRALHAARRLRVRACWASSRCCCSGRRTARTGRSVSAMPWSGSGSGSREPPPRTR